MTEPNGYINSVYTVVLWACTLQMVHFWYEYRVPKKPTTKENLINAYNKIVNLENEINELKESIRDRDAMLAHKYFSRSDIDKEYEFLLEEHDEVLHAYDMLYTSMLEQGFEGLGHEIMKNKWILSLSRSDTLTNSRLISSVQ